MTLLGFHYFARADHSTHTFTSDFQFIIQDTDEQPDKEVHRARS